MNCPKCKSKMVADNGLYASKIPNSTLYVCTGPGCGFMMRKDHEPKLSKQRKPPTGQPSLL